ncbi:MAG: hydrogenase expression/formation protein HypE [Omnitrophica WOR_2 bacterium RIFCSPHIGHO2_02_FULL_52_10]|nr:MAG: hydrogenase expression/formation protein HypE [Omnitrophica WOR_2 bacterium RIFCSPHIGHO2_02_FULL_52_10]
MNPVEIKNRKEFTITCPIPVRDYPHVLLAHGGGGKLMHQLIEKMFKAAFESSELHKGRDAAVLQLGQGKTAFTSDSYVVRPLFFPGGDIGTLAVNGTVNDLAMAGARPKYISVSFILEEGLAMEALWRVVRSIRRAALEAEVEIVTGDTKVVDRGKGDGMYINTAGIGEITHAQDIAPQNIQTGDAILLNGDLARHGMAVMAVREGLEFESAIESDCAPLADLVGALLSAGVEIHCLRDLTRGGLASALNEIASGAQREISIDEALIPVREDVASACELLGLDPLYVANEGRFIAIVPRRDQEKALTIMRKHPLGQGACLIGTVGNRGSALVTLKSRIGAGRILDMLSGEQLPRIC